MMDRYHKILEARMEEEARSTAGATFDIELHLDLVSSLIIISALQLALRHPYVPEATRSMTRYFIDSIIERYQQAGLSAYAEAARLGDNPEHDVPPGGYAA